MGIPKLNSFLKNKLKHINIFDRGIQNVHLSKYKHKTVAIDISQFIYKCRSDFIIKDLELFIDKLNYFEIKFIVVFDGKPSHYKSNTIQARKEIRNKFSKELTKLEKINKEETHTENEKIKIQTKISKLKRNTFKIKKEHITQIKNYLDSKKYSYIHLENEEGDFVCHSLYKHNYITAIISNDMDMLLHGCPIMRNYSFTSNFVDEYDSVTIFNNINMTKEQFLDFIIILGCDYLPKLGAIKINDAYFLIQLFNNIEMVIETLSYYNKESKLSFNNLNDTNKYKLLDIIKLVTISNYFIENYKNVKDLFKKNIIINQDMIKNYLH